MKSLYRVCFATPDASSQEMFIILAGPSALEFWAIALLLRGLGAVATSFMGSRDLLCAQFTPCGVMGHYLSASTWREIEKEGGEDFLENHTFLHFCVH